MDKRLSVLVDGNKKCKLCEKYLPLSDFGLWLDKKPGWVAKKMYYTSRCKPCMRIVTKQWNRDHREHLYKKGKEWREGLRNKVYEHYGNTCVCCGENNPMFLTIDHMNNDGYLNRKRDKPGGNRKPVTSSDWYKKIIEKDYPKDLQLLCYNCNCGKQRNKGTCPHDSAAAF